MAKKIKLVTLDFDYAIIEQNLRELITEQNKLTLKDIKGFQNIVRDLQMQDIIVAVATKSSKIDEIDYILQKILGANHNIIIIGDGGGANHKKAHLEKVIKTVNSNNSNPIKISKAISIDDKATIVNTITGEEQENCFGIQTKPGCVNADIELADHFMQIGETKCMGNESTFFLNFLVS